VEGDGEMDREFWSIETSETDAAGEATELGGFRVPSVTTDAFEAFHGRAVE
jgi:hypothetical protein